jgi:hypothetical protein
MGYYLFFLNFALLHLLELPLSLFDFLLELSLLDFHYFNQFLSYVKLFSAFLQLTRQIPQAALSFPSLILCLGELPFKIGYFLVIFIVVVVLT